MPADGFALGALLMIVIALYQDFRRWRRERAAAHQGLRHGLARLTYRGEHRA